MGDTAGGGNPNLVVFTNAHQIRVRVGEQMVGIFSPASADEVLSLLSLKLPQSSFSVRPKQTLKSEITQTADACETNSTSEPGPQQSSPCSTGLNMPIIVKSLGEMLFEKYDDLHIEALVGDKVIAKQVRTMWFSRWMRLTLSVTVLGEWWHCAKARHYIEYHSIDCGWNRHGCDCGARRGQVSQHTPVCGDYSSIRSGGMFSTVYHL